jgi:hypothetical protein
LELAF